LGTSVGVGKKNGKKTNKRGSTNKTVRDSWEILGAVCKGINQCISQFGATEDKKKQLRHY